MGNVIEALAQWGHGDRKDIEPIKKIRSKLSVANHLGEVAMRGRNQPDIGADSACAAQALKFLLLQHTEQLWLQFCRNVTDLVEK